MSASANRRARRAAQQAHRQPPRPRWVLIADRSRPRIEVAAVETINGLITFREFEATGATRAEALSALSRLVSQAGGVSAWEAPLPGRRYPLAYRDWLAEQAANPPDERLKLFFKAVRDDEAAS
jgi:hypothetical protein